MRQINPIIDKNIFMVKDTHEYVLKTKPDLKFKSVTTVLESFFEPFDEVKIAKHLCRTIPKYMKMKPEDLISIWHKSRDHGSEVHKEIELFIEEDIQPSEPKAKSALQWLEKYRMKSEIDVFTEVIVYSTELQIAGTVDILAYDKTDDVYEIIDWKTSKEIKTVSFKGKMGNHPVTSNIMDCNFNHYAFQLSLYRYLLENYHGVTIRNQLIGHLQDDKCTTYITPYYTKEISGILSAIN